MVYQRGTVYLKGAREKKWYGKFRVYLQDQNGKEIVRTRKVVLGSKHEFRKHEAENRLEQIIRQENGQTGGQPQNLLSDQTVTFAWFVNERFLPMRRGRWRPATQKTTEYEIQHYLVSQIGAKPLRHLSEFDLQLLLNRLAERYSESVVRHAHVNLKAIMRVARKLKLVAENPAEDLRVPETRTIERPVLSTAQIVALLGSIINPHDLCLLCIGIFCGTRTSEVLGLQWRSWQGSHLVPYGTVHEGQFYLGKMKTGASSDTIPVPELVRPIIEAWRAACADTSPEAFMFPTFGRKARAGEAVPRESKNFLRWRIHPIANRLGIPKRLVTFQVMRRTLGTDLQRYGTLKDAQRILRHADIKTTGNVYMQPIPASVMEALNKRTKEILSGDPEAFRNATVPNGSQSLLKESVSC